MGNFCKFRQRKIHFKNLQNQAIRCNLFSFPPQIPNAPKARSYKRKKDFHCYHSRKKQHIKIRNHQNLNIFIVYNNYLYTSNFRLKTLSLQLKILINIIKLFQTKIKRLQTKIICSERTLTENSHSKILMKK